MWMDIVFYYLYVYRDGRHVIIGVVTLRRDMTDALRACDLFYRRWN